MAPGRITIVGASLAGLTVAQTLRKQGFDGHLTLIGDEAREPYDRPPLSKQVLAGTRGPADVALAPGGGLADLALDLRLGQRATELDLEHREVGLLGGERVPFDAAVVATGAVPRELPGTPELDGVHVLRTLDDAIAIRAELDRSPKVVVVGAGFIGAEVAASARGLDLDVTVIEVLPVPLSQALGPAMGEVCARLHRDNGVDLRCGVGVAGFEGTERVEAVVLSDGARVDADLVVVGIGVRPATDWLAGSGLDVADGVVCDATLQAVGAPLVYAAGDVARWDHPLYGEQVRIEHWTNAADQGRAVARNLLADVGAAEPFGPVPYVWSDQHGVKIQVLGRCRADDEVEVVLGSVEEHRFVALYGRDGMLHGALGFAMPGKLMRFNPLLQRRATWAEGVDFATTLR